MSGPTLQPTTVTLQIYKKLFKNRKKLDGAAKHFFSTAL